MAMKPTEDDYVSEEDEDYVPSEAESDEEHEDAADDVDDDLMKPSEASSKAIKQPVSKLQDGEKKKQIDDLWEDFLKDTGTNLDPVPSSSNAVPSATVTVKSKVDVNATDVKECSTKDINDKTIITEIFDFAGEEVRVDKVVTKAEAERRKSQIDTPKRKEPSGGLSDVVKMLSKKPKMSVLDKTGHDWKQFVEEKGIEEELKTYNRGQGGFLDKQIFLNEADYKQFENERNVRKSRREK